MKTRAEMLSQRRRNLPMKWQLIRDEYTEIIPLRSKADREVDLAKDIERVFKGE